MKHESIDAVLLDACEAVAKCTKPALGSDEFRAWIKARDAVANAKRLTAEQAAAKIVKQFGKSLNVLAD